MPALYLIIALVIVFLFICCSELYRPVGEYVCGLMDEAATAADLKEKKD